MSKWKTIFIFKFVIENDLDKEKKEFAEKTATMDLISSTMFEKRNILIFYNHEQDINSDVPFEKEI